MREVLYDEDREDTSERRVREAERRADVVDVERHVCLVASCSCPRDLNHARSPVDADDVITAPRECERVRARPAAEVGHWPGRCHHVRDLGGDPFDQLTMLRLLAA